MADAIWSGVFLALRGFMLFGAVAASRHLSKDILKKETPFKLIWQGVLTCGIIALIAASQLGKPSCEQDDGDPLHGSCEVYADDGYDPSDDERTKQFVYIFLLLYAPVVITAANEAGQRKAWR